VLIQKDSIGFALASQWHPGRFGTQSDVQAVGTFFAGADEFAT
jgi:hypothetical protein